MSRIIKKKTNFQFYLIKTIKALNMTSSKSKSETKKRTSQETISQKHSQTEENSQKNQSKIVAKDLTELYVEPHNKQAREVTEDDLDRVIEDMEKMDALLRVGNGKYKSGLAIAHTQIENEDPLAFFVTQEGEAVINPEIVNHTEHKNLHEEGCLSFPEKDTIHIGRHYRITLRMQTLDVEDEDVNLTEEFSYETKGDKAKVFQHEIDHLNGINIYDKKEKQ